MKRKDIKYKIVVRVNENNVTNYPLVLFKEDLEILYIKIFYFYPTEKDVVKIINEYISKYRTKKFERILKNNEE